MKMKWNQN